MKTLKILIGLLIFVISCRKDKDSIPKINFFRAGIIDSVNCYYKKFPTKRHLNYRDSIDVDNDKKPDLLVFTLIGSGPWIDGVPTHTYEVSLFVLDDHLLITGPLSKGDTINSLLTWSDTLSNIYFETFLGEVTVDTWSSKRPDCYLGYQKIQGNDTIYAWSNIDVFSLTSIIDYQKDRK